MDSPVYVHPLGLSCGGYRPTAIERLAVSPNATLFSAAMSDPTGVCSSLTTISTFSLSPYLSIHSSFSPLRVHVSIHLPNSSCCSYLFLDAARLLYPSAPLSLSLSLLVTKSRLFWSHMGGLSNETYKTNTSPKVGQVPIGGGSKISQDNQNEEFFSDLGFDLFYFSIRWCIYI